MNVRQPAELGPDIVGPRPWRRGFGLERDSGFPDRGLRGLPRGRVGATSKRRGVRRSSGLTRDRVGGLGMTSRAAAGSTLPRPWDGVPGRPLTLHGQADGASLL